MQTTTSVALGIKEQGNPLDSTAVLKSHTRYLRFRSESSNSCLSFNVETVTCFLYDEYIWAHEHFHVVLPCLEELRHVFSLKSQARRVDDDAPWVLRWWLLSIKRVVTCQQVCLISSIESWASEDSVEVMIFQRWCMLGWSRFQGHHMMLH